MRKSLRVQLAHQANSWQLVQERFPVGGYPSCGSRHGLISWMRTRRKQLHTLDRDHRLLLVIIEPVLTRLKAGYDRMPRCRRVFGCMLTWRIVTATDVPALRTPAEMEPPTFRRRKAFHTAVAAWLRSGIDSAETLFLFRFSSRHCTTSNEFKPPAGFCRPHPFLPLLEPRPLH